MLNTASQPATESAELALYHQLHDELSDMIEDGRLKQTMFPDDYKVVAEGLAFLAGNPTSAPENPATMAALNNTLTDVIESAVSWISEDADKKRATPPDNWQTFFDVLRTPAVQAVIVNAFRAMAAKKEVVNA
jgi:hypothetical protein